MKNDISILIPTHNRVEQLQRTLDSIAKQVVNDPELVEVVVVANGCSDTTISDVEARIADFPFILRIVDEQVLGLPSARNRAVAEAKHGILAFLDDDVILLDGYIASLFDVYSNYPADMAGGRTELLWEAVQRPDWFPDSLLNLLSCKDHGDEVIELKSPVDALGANFSFRRHVVDAIGLFRLGLGRSGKLLLGGEETEFLTRALNRNFRLFYAPGCHLKHWVAPNRPTPEYLSGVANGTAMSYIFFRPRLTPWWVLKASAYHSAQIMKYACLQFCHWIGGNKGRRIENYVHRRRHQGYLAGIWLRLMGKSTLQDLS